MIDAHIHLHQYKNVEQKVEEWQAAGVTGVVAVSDDLRSSYETLSLKQKYNDFIFAAIGFHPEQPLPSSRDVVEWQCLLQQNRHMISAIGEVGLPYYTLHSHHQHGLQEYIHFLDELIAIGKKEDLPIVLHAVHSHASLAFQLLAKHNAKKAHFHWLKAEQTVARQIVEQGYYVSVTPEVCYRQRDQSLAQLLPITHLLAETDGPWSFTGIFQNRLTSPLFLNEVIKTISVLKESPYETTFRQLKLNTLALYGQ